jgi:hypothetical protein
MNVSSVWDVLKWVLAVLAAGFVGQFGRVLAMRLIERRRNKRTARPLDSDTEIASPPSEHSVERERLKTLVKLEKKRAKADLKKAKKEAEDS